jgi:hypothetical protein
MSFGYLGDTSTKIKQFAKNAGVLTTKDVLELENKKHIGGSIEALNSIDIGGVSALDVDVSTSVTGGSDVIMFIGENVHFSSDDALSVRISKDDSSDIDSGATNYESAATMVTFNGTTTESRSTGSNNFQISQDLNSATNDCCHFTLFCYNLLTTGHPAFTYHSLAIDASAVATSRFMYGGAEFTANAALDVMRFFPTFGSGATMTGQLTMYGFKAQ